MQPGDGLGVCWPHLKVDISTLKVLKQTQTGFLLFLTSTLTQISFPK